jgi:prepilin-type N-terminal cleavage/methylation domain-containing protein
MLKNMRRSEGLSLVELIVTIAVLAIVTSIATPIFLSQQSAAHRATAIADGRGWSLAILEATSTVRNLGESGGEISLVGTNVTMSLISPNPSSAEVISFPVAVSPASSLSSGSAAGQNWCLAVSNNNEVAVFTDQGYQPTAVACSPLGTSVNP